MGKTKQFQQEYVREDLIRELYNDNLSSWQEVWQYNHNLEPWYEVQVSSHGNITITIPKRTTADGTIYYLIRGQYIPLDYIVASTYLANPNDYTSVIHVDGNKRNNKVHNLRWDTDPTHQRPSKPRHQVITELVSSGVNPLPSATDQAIYNISYEMTNLRSHFNINTGQYMIPGYENSYNSAPKVTKASERTLSARYNHIQELTHGLPLAQWMEEDKKNPDNTIFCKDSGVRYDIPTKKVAELVEQLEQKFREEHPQEAFMDEYLHMSRTLSSYEEMVRRHAREKAEREAKKVQTLDNQDNYNDSSVNIQEILGEYSENTQSSTQTNTEAQSKEQQSSQNQEDNHNNSINDASKTESSSQTGLTTKEMLEQLRKNTISQQKVETQTEKTQTTSPQSTDATSSNTGKSTNAQKPTQSAGDWFGYSTYSQATSNSVDKTSTQGQQTQPIIQQQYPYSAQQEQYGQASIITTAKHQSPKQETQENHNNSPMFSPEHQAVPHTFSREADMFSGNRSVFKPTDEDLYTEEEYNRAHNLEDLSSLVQQEGPKFYIDPMTKKFAVPPVDKNGNKIYTPISLEPKKWEYPHKITTDQTLVSQNNPTSLQQINPNELMTDEQARAMGLAFAPPITMQMRSDIYMENKLTEMSNNFNKAQQTGGVADVEAMKKAAEMFKTIPFPELARQGWRTPNGGKPVAVIERDGTRRIFNSISEAATFCNINKSNITRCCKGQIAQCHGLKFCYVDPRDINTVFKEYINDINGKENPNITEFRDRPRKRRGRPYKDVNHPENVAYREALEEYQDKHPRVMSEDLKQRLKHERNRVAYAENKELQKEQKMDKLVDSLKDSMSPEVYQIIVSEMNKKKAIRKLQEQQQELENHNDCLDVENIADNESETVGSLSEKNKN